MITESPLKCLNLVEWRKICKKYKVSVKTNPKYLGGGVSAQCYHLRTDLVIKFTSCAKTINVAKSIVKKNLTTVAKVLEITPCTKGGKHYIIQEYVEKSNNAISKKVCSYFVQYVGATSNLKPNELKLFNKMIEEYSAAGIKPSKVCDLHEANVYGLGKDQVKIVDIGSLAWG